MAGCKKLKIFLVFVLSFLLINNFSSSEELCNLNNSSNWGFLESTIFDLGESYNLKKLSWQGEKTEKHFVGFQIASSNSSSGPWIFYGENLSSEYINIQPFQIYSFDNTNPHKNIRYFKYKIFLASCEEFTTPQINKIIIYYSK